MFESFFEHSQTHFQFQIKTRNEKERKKAETKNEIKKKNSITKRRCLIKRYLNFALNVSVLC